MIFKHQDTVIQTDHIIALRTEHPLANGKHVVALYTAYGKPLQLTMTAAERDELVAAMDPIEYRVAPLPDVTPEFAAALARTFGDEERVGR
jgi:hypothetical protein